MATPVPRFIRVRQTDTRHQLDVPPSYLTDFPDAYEPLDDQERWPDLYGPGAQARAPLHNVNLGSRAEDGDRPDTGDVAQTDGVQPVAEATGSTGDASTKTASKTTRPAKEA